MATNPITFQAIPEGGTVPTDLAAFVLNGGSNYGLHVANWLYTGSLWVPQRGGTAGYMQVEATPALQVYNVGTAAGTAAASGTITLVGTATIGDYYNIVRGGFQTNHAGTLVFQWSPDPDLAVVTVEQTYSATANEKVSIMHPNFGTYFHAHFVNSSGAGATVSSELYAGNWVS